MILPVVELPDPHLKQASHAVSPNDPGLQKLIDQMLATMMHHPRCVGLAAPQVGKNVRIIVIDAGRVDKPGSRHGRLALLNPQITREERSRLLREGCLSIPDYTGNVLRYDAVEVRALNRDGREVRYKAHGFEAVVFQHEVDHLDGKLFLDRVGSLETDVFRRKSYG